MSRREARSRATQAALMRAAEKLIARKGIENVTLREIVTAAGQKNESALQYHFGNLNGLIRALHASREAEIQGRREALLADLLTETATPSLRQICRVMVRPAFELARSNPDFRRYVQAFGHDITLADESALTLINRKGGRSIAQTGSLLRAALPHLDEAAFRRRMDAALRFVAASMVHQARRRNGFRGAEGEIFFASLIDALEGLLGAPESAETKALSRGP
jgi:AcrR family transcriptional regulator